MQLIAGFAQCAENKEVCKHFLKGKELANKQIQMMQDFLLDSDVQFSVTSGNTITTSSIPPFSDKLMMFCIYLLNGYGIVGSSFGTFFSLRNDISMKTLLLSKDVYFYAQEGIEIMIKHRWFEEPPQMENRKGIYKSNLE